MNTWKLIREDKAEYYRMMMQMFPLARTPMDKKGGSSLESYHKSLQKAIDSMTPWSKRQHNRLAGLRSQLKSGEAMVILGKGERAEQLPILPGMKVVKE